MLIGGTSITMGSSGAQNGAAVASKSDVVGDTCPSDGTVGKENGLSYVELVEQRTS